MIYLLIILILPYLIIPVIIKRQQHFSLYNNIRQLTSEFIPRAFRKPREKWLKELQKIGFNHCVDVVYRDYGPNLSLYQSLFFAPKDNTAAICSVLLTDTSTEPLRKFVEFFSRWQNLEIRTHNSDVAGAPLENKHKKICALFPAISVSTLFRVHQKRLNKLGPNNYIQCLIPKDQAFIWLTENFKKELQVQTQLGGLYFDPNHNCFRPTWAGAFLMSWYSMWPISLLRRFRSRIRSYFKIKALS